MVVHPKGYVNCGRSCSKEKDRNIRVPVNLVPTILVVPAILVPAILISMLSYP